jgi:hypothetical protein
VTAGRGKLGDGNLGTAFQTSVPKFLRTENGCLACSFSTESLSLRHPRTWWYIVRIMRVDESELRSRFRSMSQEDFSRLQRTELTPEGQRAYDEDFDRRAAEERAIPRCPECRSEIVPGANFCSVCGYSLTGATPAQSVTDSAAQHSSPSARVSSVPVNTSQLGPGPAFKFWLTWKEFVAAMLLLIAFSSAAAAGSSDSAYAAAQSAGTLGAIYIVVFIIRKMRARDWD